MAKDGIKEGNYYLSNIKKEEFNMRKLLKSKKGFSLIELLIVLAILAIIAAISISVFGGVLSNSKDKADKQQASNIKKAIQTYLADSNDTNFSMGGSAPTTSDALITKLGAKISITTAEQYDNLGDFGPYLDTSAGTIKPQNASHAGWDITYTPATQAVTVAAGTGAINLTSGVLPTPTP